MELKLTITRKELIELLDPPIKHELHHIHDLNDERFNDLIHRIEERLLSEFREHCDDYASLRYFFKFCR